MKFGKTECRNSIGFEDEVKDHGEKENFRKELVDCVVF